MRRIHPDDLVAMETYTATTPLDIHVAYAHADNFLFREAIYRPDAQLWLHKDLARIVVKAAQILNQSHGYCLRLYDGLRTIEAQESMRLTHRVRDNPHWLTPPALLSSPGQGAHPRAMAIDLTVLHPDGTPADMGTDFDYLAPHTGPRDNPAHRAYTNLSPDVIVRRTRLTQAMQDAAAAFHTPLLPLAEEWWDYRLPSEITLAYAPLSENDLPHAMRLLSSQG